MTLARGLRTRGRSVLLLESDDIQLSNVFVVTEAVQRALAAVPEVQPDIILLAESDSAPYEAWLLKEGSLFGDKIPVVRGHKNHYGIDSF